MANFILFCSSIFILVIQISTFVLFDLPYFFSLLGFLAAITSIFNHAFTNNIIKNVDRLYITYYISANVFFIFTSNILFWYKNLLYLLILSGILSVCTAMKIKNNYLHIYSHLILVIVHLLLSIEFSK